MIRLGSVYGGVVMMVDAEVKRTMRQHVKERDEARLCLLCDQPVDSRGLCSKHYQRFRARYRKQPVDKQPEFEAKAIYEGMLLPDRQGQRPSVKDEFKALAEGE